MTNLTDSTTQETAEIDKILALGSDPTRINLAYAAMKIIENAAPSSRPVILRHLAERWDSAQSSGELEIPSIITQDDVRRLSRRYGKLIDNMLVFILQDNPTVESFYERAHDILSNPVLQNENDRAFALYWMLIDKRMPYFQLSSGLRLADEDWKLLGQRLTTEMDKIRFILSSPIFEQRSEQADILLRELDKFDRLERVRLMSYLIFQIDNSAEQRGRAQSTGDE